MLERLTPLGIDISKAHFHVALLKGPKRDQYQQFTNDSEGFAQLTPWRSPQGSKPFSALKGRRDGGYPSRHRTHIAATKSIFPVHSSSLFRTKNPRSARLVLSG